MNRMSTRTALGARVAVTPARIAAAVVLAACGLAAGLAPAAIALPGSSVGTYYFSTAAKTKLVGHSHLSCGGGFAKSGKITPYYEAYDTPCN